LRSAGLRPTWSNSEIRNPTSKPAL
jgi:hypothetical protein